MFSRDTSITILEPKPYSLLYCRAMGYLKITSVCCNADANLDRLVHENMFYRIMTGFLNSKLKLRSRSSLVVHGQCIYRNAEAEKE